MLHDAIIGLGRCSYTKPKKYLNFDYKKWERLFQYEC